MSEAVHGEAKRGIGRFKRLLGKSLFFGAEHDGDGLVEWKGQQIITVSIGSGSDESVTTLFDGVNA